MPGGDGTGPYGTGGRCTPLWMSGQIERPFGRPLGFGRGMGRGRGYRWINRATGLPYWTRTGTDMPREQELQLLEQQMNEIKKRIDELKKE